MGWIGVDLDGTLAHYDEFVSPTHIGEPIAMMVERVRRWIKDGKEVRIFTARVGTTKNDGRDVQEVRMAIDKWCIKHIGQSLEITNLKDFGMIELWDDRCVQVARNTGMPVATSSARKAATKLRVKHENKTPS